MVNTMGIQQVASIKLSNEIKLDCENFESAAEA